MECQSGSDGAFSADMASHAALKKMKKILNASRGLHNAHFRFPSFFSSFSSLHRRILSVGYRKKSQVVFRKLRMTKTRSMTSNQNHDSSSSSSSRKRFKSFDNGDAGRWSDINHDVLFIIMMQLGFFEFLSFSRVCRSWRLFAFSNRKLFMASKPPMSIYTHMKANKNDYCYLEDFKRRKLKTIIPHYTGRICVGSTCGYLVLFSEKTCDFWLVNPITTHELHFPDFPLFLGVGFKRIRTILVYSPSISNWVFVVFISSMISYYIAGKKRWHHVSSNLPIIDVHFFKGKMYTLHDDCSLGELKLHLKSKQKLTLFKTTSFMNTDLLLKPELVSSDEKIYLVDRVSQPEKVMELDIGGMKWVLPEKTIGEYVFFISMLNPSVAIKPESWAGLETKYNSYERMFNYKMVWYFPHDCLNVNRLDE
ncbi:hypothetical protein LXL04_032054 [Taraxacum kok-saghyz]